MRKETRNKLIILSMIIVLLILGVTIFVMSTKKEENVEKPSNNTVVTKKPEENTASVITHKTYGDYVDYPIDLNGDGKTNNDWEIFYKNDERVFIIAADYIPEIGKFVDLESCNLEVNGAYGIFWNSVPPYQKVDNSKLKLFSISNLYDIKKLNENSNSKCVSTLLNTDNWKNFVKTKYADYAIGGPTMEMWVESWNEKYGKVATIEYDMGKMGYYLGTDALNPEFDADLSGTAGYDNALYFPHTSTYKLCTGYWIASASEKLNYNIITVSYNGFLSSEDYSFNTRALRPVVALKKGITAEYDEKNEIWKIK